jgi:ubiquinone/menaquinone biosynthesis C-methylase UbiE
LLEIGCGDGGRLSWLNKYKGLNCSGIDPSAKAVKIANDKGVQSIIGTADKLPFKNNEFDIVIFGFCLYLCDVEDLFQISQEADRVLKKTGWIIIHDFYSKSSITNKYKHCDGVNSHKMDYRKLFDWHPAYTCYSHEIKHHVHIEFTDEVNEWVGLSILRKNFSEDNYAR